MLVASGKANNHDDERQKADALHDFKIEMMCSKDNLEYVEKIFNLLHTCRGYALAMHSSFPVNAGPSDEDIERHIEELNSLVGDPYPPKK